MANKKQVESVELNHEEMDFIRLALNVAKAELEKMYKKATAYKMNGVVAGLQKDGKFVGDLEAKFLYGDEAAADGENED